MGTPTIFKRMPRHLREFHFDKTSPHSIYGQRADWHGRRADWYWKKSDAWFKLSLVCFGVSGVAFVVALAMSTLGQ